MLSTALLAGEENRLACQGSGPDGCALPIYENMSDARVWHSFQETDGKKLLTNGQILNGFKSNQDFRRIRKYKLQN
jgi:hypothetical protein